MPSPMKSSLTKRFPLDTADRISGPIHMLRPPVINTIPFHHRIQVNTTRRILIPT